MNARFRTGFVLLLTVSALLNWRRLRAGSGRAKALRKWLECQCPIDNNLSHWRIARRTQFLPLLGDPKMLSPRLAEMRRQLTAKGSMARTGPEDQLLQELAVIDAGLDKIKGTDLENTAFPKGYFARGDAAQAAAVVTCKECGRPT
jgi:hypothetical protein